MKKIIKLPLIIVGSLVGALVLGVGSYLGYVILEYSRIENHLVLEVRDGATNNHLALETPYSISTYNLGFGAYGPDFDFFLDTGVMKDGTKTSGHLGTAISKEQVLDHITGASEVIRDLDVDFALFQEVDTHSDRSYHVNQDMMLQETFVDYDSTHAVNFHSAYLLYPFNDPHGKSLSGLTTFSRFAINAAVRESFTVSNAFPDKFFDLDRCFSVHEVAVSNGHKLILINLHMSAYDQGGIIRAQQMQELAQYLTTAYQEGDYVIAGGDFNHDLLVNNPDFDYQASNFPFQDETTQQKPEWLAYFFEEDGSSVLPNGFNLVASDNTSTCRGADLKWTPGVNFVTVIDGFIVSDNVEVVRHENILTSSSESVGYAYSDHQPAYLEFSLKV